MTCEGKGKACVICRGRFFCAIAGEGASSGRDGGGKKGRRHRAEKKFVQENARLLQKMTRHPEKNAGAAGTGHILSMHLWTVLVIALVRMIFSAIIRSGNRKKAGIAEEKLPTACPRSIRTLADVVEDGTTAADVAPEAAKGVNINH